MEWSNGYRAWYQNGLRHRLDGPAVEYSDGINEYWIKGELYSKKEFDKKIKSLNNQVKMIIILVK
jgi:hypothetical protein